MDYRIIKLWNLIPKELRKCSKCGEEITNPREAEVNHKDGKRYNDDVENLEINCPKCHRGRNDVESMIGITFRVPKSMLKKLDERAQKDEINQSVLIRKIIDKYLDE